VARQPDHLISPRYRCRSRTHPVGTIQREVQLWLDVE
jgi:hypothetical protein